jgi:hypothetical protein
LFPPFGGTEAWITRVAEKPEQLPTVPGGSTGGTATETFCVTGLPGTPLSTGVALKVVVDVTDTDWVAAVVVGLSPTTAGEAVQLKLAPAVQPSAVSATGPPPADSEGGDAVSDVQLGAPAGGGGGGVLESQVTVTLPFPSGTAVKLAQALLVIVTLAAITGAAVTHRSAATARDAGVGTKSVRYMSGFLE